MNPAWGVVSSSWSPTTAHGERLSLSDNRELTHSSTARSERAQRLQLLYNVQHSRKLLEAEWFVLSAWADGTEPRSPAESTWSRVLVTCVQPWSSTHVFCRILLETTTRTKCGNGERSFSCLVLNKVMLIMLISEIFTGSTRLFVDWCQTDAQAPVLQWAKCNIELISRQSLTSKV